MSLIQRGGILFILTYSTPSIISTDGCIRHDLANHLHKPVTSEPEWTETHLYFACQKQNWVQILPVSTPDVEFNKKCIAGHLTAWAEQTSEGQKPIFK